MATASYTYAFANTTTTFETKDLDDIRLDHVTHISYAQRGQVQLHVDHKTWVGTQLSCPSLDEVKSNEGGIIEWKTGGGNDPLVENSWAEFIYQQVHGEYESSEVQANLMSNYNSSCDNPVKTENLGDVLKEKILHYLYNGRYSNAQYNMAKIKKLLLSDTHDDAITSSQGQLFFTKQQCRELVVNMFDYGILGKTETKNTDGKDVYVMKDADAGDVFGIPVTFKDKSANHAATTNPDFITEPQNVTFVLKLVAGTDVASNPRTVTWKPVVSEDSINALSIPVSIDQDPEPLVTDGP